MGASSPASAQRASCRRQCSGVPATATASIKRVVHQVARRRRRVERLTERTGAVGPETGIQQDRPGRGGHQVVGDEGSHRSRAWRPSRLIAVSTYAMTVSAGARLPRLRTRATCSGDASTAQCTPSALSREPERFRALHAEQHGHRLGGSTRADAIDREDLAANGDPLAASRPGRSRHTRADRRGRLERNAHLRLDPSARSRAEPQHDAPRRDAARAAVSMASRRVPRVRIHHAEADRSAR